MTLPNKGGQMEHLQKVWYTQTADPITIHNRTITMESQVLSLRFPFGGFVWQRPTAVHVTENNQTHTLPIVDPTRQALWVLAGISFVVSLLAWLRRK
jgi:hypothetical protein